MQVPYLGRAPRTKETLPDFLKWRRVTRPPLVFRGLTGSQRTPGFWGVTVFVKISWDFKGYGLFNCYPKRRKKKNNFPIVIELINAHQKIITKKS